MAIVFGMATPKIKATYSLDPETVDLLERAARRWGVSKSEALRRAIHACALSADDAEPVASLDRLQEIVALQPSAAAAWTRRVRAERRAERNEVKRRS